MERSTAYVRESVSLDEAVRLEIQDAPEALGFDPNSSISSRLRDLIRDGLEVRRERGRRAERLATYRAWAGDEESADVIRKVADETRREGGFVDGFRDGPAQPAGPG